MYIDKDGNEMDYDDALEQLLHEHGFWEFEPQPVPADAAAREKINQLLKEIRKLPVQSMGFAMEKHHFTGFLKEWAREGSYVPEKLRQIEGFVTKALNRK